MQDRFIVLGKHETQKRFRMMDINGGLQVPKIRATILTDQEAQTFMTKEAPRNPDWEFKLKPLRQEVCR